MIKRVVLTAISLVAIVGLGAAAPSADASAMTSDSSTLGYAVINGIQSGAITRSNITSLQEAALLDVVTPVREELLDTWTSASVDKSATTRTSATCWSTWQRWGQKSSHGNTLYTWWQGLRWCSQGGRIVSSSVFDRGGETSTPGWSFNGHGGQGSWNVGWEVRQYTQENFTFGIGWFSFTSTKCGQIRGGITGMFSQRDSCGLN